MGYNNKFSLRLCGGEKTINIIHCPQCGNTNEGKFCQDCGTQMVMKEEIIDVDISIIDEFREYSINASYLIDSVGDPHDTGNGYSLVDDLVKFSLNYPDTLFELLCEWDSCFGDPPSKEYIKNGKKYTEVAKIVFDDFDENKLK